MSSNRSAAGVTVFEGRIFVSGGHDGLQIFNSVSCVVFSLFFAVCFLPSSRIEGKRVPLFNLHDSTVSGSLG